MSEAQEEGESKNITPEMLLWLYRSSQRPVKKPLLLLPFKALTAS